MTAKANVPSAVMRHKMKCLLETDDESYSYCCISAAATPDASV